eukprot:scaffold626_cov337-Pavlova_lutheri.AAC.45
MESVGHARISVFEKGATSQLFKCVRVPVAPGYNGAAKVFCCSINGWRVFWDSRAMTCSPWPVVLLSLACHAWHALETALPFPFSLPRIATSTDTSGPELGGNCLPLEKRRMVSFRS